MNESNNHNQGSTLILGIAIGAALTYLFTTKNGQKLKNQLLEEGKKLLNQIGEDLDNFGDEVAEKKEETQEKLESGIKAVEALTEEVPAHIEKIQKKGRRFFFHKSTAQES